MRLDQSDRWRYDPRPLVRLSLDVRYDHVDGKLRLNVACWREGDDLPVRGTYDGLDLDSVAEYSAVVFSSLASDYSDPFDGP